MPISPVDTASMGGLPTGAIAGECSGVFSPAPSGSGGSVVVTYNAFPNFDTTLNSTHPGGGILGWNFNSAAGFPTTWSVCNATVAGAYTVGHGCAGPIPPVFTPNSWSGDPVVAADGRGNVVIVSLANNTSRGGRDVVASISTNGGATFSDSVLVNLGSTDCLRDGAEDQPAVTFDREATPPRIWVAWRHRQPPPFSDIYGAWGGCLVGGTIDTTTPSPSIHFLGDGVPHVIQNMRRETPRVEIGQGGLRLVARTGSFGGVAGVERVAVVYSTTDDMFTDCSGRAVSWEMVVTDDGGHGWSSSVPMAHVDPYRWCVDGVSSVPGGNVPVRSIREVDVALDRTTGAFWAAVAANATLSLYLSPDDASWHHVIDIPNNLGGRAIWLPAIAVDEHGRVAATYYATDAAGMIQRMLVASPAGAYNLAAPWSSPVPISNGPFVGSGAEAPSDGDYMSTFDVPRGTFGIEGTFMAAWAQFVPSAAVPLDHQFTASIIVAP